MQIKVCTNTLYKGQDNVRPALALESIRSCLALDIDLTLVNESKTDNLLFSESVKEFIGHPKFHYFEIPSDLDISMGEGRRLNYFLSAGGDYQTWLDFKRGNPDTEFDYYNYLTDNQLLEEEVYHLWTEPEKTGLFTQKNIDTMLECTQEGRIPIFVLERDVDTMHSLPDFQLCSETSMNLYSNQMIRELSIDPKDGTKRVEYKATDLNFGPKGMNWQGIKYFLGSRERLWGSIIAPVADAVKAGLEIGSTVVDFQYEDSTLNQENESSVFDEKRMVQYWEVLESLRRSTERQITFSTPEMIY